METVVRVAIIYFFLLFGLRVLGKREIGELTPFEFVTLLIIPEIVQQAAVGEDFSMVNALVACSTIFCLVFANSLLSYRFKSIQTASEGEPIVLVRHGRLLTKHLEHEHVRADEIFTEMHKSGVERLDQVKWAILEPDGKVSIIQEQNTGDSPRPDDRKISAG